MACRVIGIVVRNQGILESREFFGNALAFVVRRKCDHVNPLGGQLDIDHAALGAMCGKPDDHIPLTLTELTGCA